MNWNSKARKLVLTVVGTMVLASVATAQPRSGVIGDVVPRDDLKDRIAVPQDRRPEPAKARECDEDINARLSAGLPVWFFQDEDTEAAPGAYLDIFDPCAPLNFRVGVEGRHIDLTQDEAEGSAEPGESAAKITYIRIPFALEYAMEVDDATTLYLGGGPDLLNAANDIDDFSVGGHIGARALYAFDENWGVSVEGGYMWASFDGNDGGDINLDGWYVTPALAYTF